MVIETGKEDEEGEFANFDLFVQTSNTTRSVEKTTGLQ